ncbi:MAG: hypothetical protein CV089_20225 [Nitrospira sp. WS110]|nr:hypothetical protein [Nitrospira sp. WS110]
MANADQQMTRILIQLPPSLKAYLDELRCHGYTAAGYIRGILENDRMARLDAGWKPGKGWPDSRECVEPHFLPLRKAKKQKGLRGTATITKPR